MEYIKKNAGFLLFSFYLTSVLFWFFEIVYSLIFRHLLVNPGTLYGPYCPIYGLAFVIIVMSCKKEDKLIFKIIKIAITSTVIEYVISFICEKIYHTRIWDYSDKFLNINGRVCLEMTVLFIIAGLLILYFFVPPVKKLYDKMGPSVKYINIVLGVIFLADLIITLITKASL